MVKDIFDLFVRVQNERIRLRAEKNHPADINALTKGVFTGLNLGLHQMSAMGFEHSDLAITFLANGYHNPLSSNLEAANRLMPEDKPFTSAMFVGLSYRTSPSHRFYEKGMNWGFHYVLDLYQVFLDPSSEVVARRMTVDHVKAVVKMLEHL